MKDFFDKYADDIGKPMEYVSFRRNDVLKLRTDNNTLVQAVTNLLDQINGSDYVDLVGDDTRLQAVIDVVGWQPKPKVTIGMQPKWWIGEDGN